jgi:glutaconate CoA-transferase subunit B
MTQERHYRITELMAYAAAKFLEDKKSVYLGSGLPLIAALFAQKTHAPNLVIFFEAGGIGPLIPALPSSVGDSRTFYKAIAASSMHDVNSQGQAGYLEYGFLGAAQLDMYGNINTTYIGGTYERPKVRLPGSGGANDVASFCHQLIILMLQRPNGFVKRLDFLTTPGYLTGPGARERAGLPEDTGPYRVITQLAVYDFDEETKRMRLFSLHPGVTVEDVKANAGFEIIIPEQVPITEEPSEEDCKLLCELDPLGISLG